MSCEPYLYLSCLSSTPNNKLLNKIVRSRVSVRSLIVKDWKNLYFSFNLNSGDLGIYRSQNDMNQGKNFSKKVIPIHYNHRCTPIKCKEYSKGGTLWTFGIEEVFDYGPSLRIKFAAGHSEKGRMENLRERVDEFISKKRKEVR